MNLRLNGNEYINEYNVPLVDFLRWNITFVNKKKFFQAKHKGTDKGKDNE